MKTTSQTSLSANSQMRATKPLQSNKSGFYYIATPRLGMALFTLFMACGAGSVLSATIPNSEVNYPGASTTAAFVAKEPYVLNIQGVSKTISLGGASRSHDFSGAVPFVNPATGNSDPSVFQAYSRTQGLAAGGNDPYIVDWYGNQITNAGVVGRIGKTTFGSDAVTMVKYNAGDGIAYEKCRTKMGSYPVPPRTHVRWEFEVAFGKADGINDWKLTPSTHWGYNGSEWVIDNGAVPVLFWALTSEAQSNGPLDLSVDTDNLDPTKLVITSGQRVGTAPEKTEIMRVHGIQRHTMIPIVVEAFLDERETANGGKGILKIWVNNQLTLERTGPTLARGTKPHYWSMNTYLWSEPRPSPYTRATFWKTARMFVYPTNAGSSADTAAPTAPTNLAADAPNATTANLLWSASADNTGIAGYKIYRDGAEIDTSSVTNYSDTSVVGGTTYNYTVKAYDGSGNLSAASNIATVKTPTATGGLNISSYFADKINYNDATINWTTNAPSSAVIYYGRTTSLGSSASYNSLSTNHSLKLTGLWDGYVYYYKIVAKNSTGATYTSPVSSFKTRWY
jgi:hypothetical protein